MSHSSKERFWLRIYRALLRLYPPAFLRRYGDEMTRLFTARLDELRGQRAAMFAMLVGAAWDAIANGIAERIRERGLRRRKADMAAILARRWRRTRRNRMSLRMDVRDARRTRWIEDVLADTRFAFRAMRRTPAFAAALLFMLAIGIGASTTIFALINAIVVRQLPVPNPEELVAIGDPSIPTSSGQGVTTVAMSYPLYRDIRSHTASLSGVLAAGPTDRLDVAIGPGDGLEHPVGRFVSDNYFSVLGVHAVRGRVFDGTEDQAPGRSPAVVISDAWWARRFNRDPAIVGRTVRVNGTPMTIVGVTAPTFSGEVVGQSTDLWLPASMHDALKPRDRRLDRRNAIWLLLLGRLAPGRTIEDARAELEPFVIRTIAENATGRAGADFLASKPEVMITPGDRGFSELRDEFRTPLVTLLIGVLILLAIICSNIANLLLARAVTRAREMTVRLALGAQRSRLIRMLLTESVVLAVADRKSVV